MLTINLDENTANICRGFIIEYIDPKTERVVIYSNNNWNRTLAQKQKYNFIEIKNLLPNSFFDKNNNKDYFDSYNNFPNMLLENKTVEILNIRMYKTFINDLINIIHNFSFFLLMKEKWKITIP